MVAYALPRQVHVVINVAVQLGLQALDARIYLIRVYLIRVVELGIVRERSVRMGLCVFVIRDIVDCFVMW